MAHQNKHIRGAIAYALQCGWRFEEPKGRCSHTYGALKCPHAGRDGCNPFFVRSTPRVPMNHARQILRAVQNCPH